MRAIRQGLRDGGYQALRDRVTSQFAAPSDDPQSTGNGPIQAHAETNLASDPRLDE